MINYRRTTCILWLSFHFVSCTILYSLQVITALFFFYFLNFSMFLKQFMPRLSTQLKWCANISELIHYASPALFITVGWGFLFVPYWYFSDISRREDKRICSINHIEQGARDWCLISVCTIETLQMLTNAESHKTQSIITMSRCGRICSLQMGSDCWEKWPQQISQSFHLLFFPPK